MTSRLQNFIMVALFAFLSLFWAQSFVSQNSASGGYQFFEQGASGNFADNPLIALEKIFASPEIAPDYANAPKGGGTYSGDLKKVNVNDPDADALADKIGGQSSVKFDGDPNGREFDVVSDQYVGQAKPANFQGGSSFRNQAKATFEAAQETGREVYYHFDGPPSPSVINKLNEYSERYGVPVVIDTDPF